MNNTANLILKANRLGIAVPAFNVPHLPMIEPIIRAVIDEESFALIEIARIEWLKIDEAVHPKAVAAEFNNWADLDFVRLHMDHVPVIDEDGSRVGALPLLHQAVDLGYHSVMIDGSRLPLEENIAATLQAVELAHAAGIPCEAELGSLVRPVKEMISYEDFYRSGAGFTKVSEAQRFVQETGCDWLSVAAGSFHGPLSDALKDIKKPEARLNLDLLEELRAATRRPLVLHGGSGVRQADVLAAVQAGITKINVGSENRQAYEAALKSTGSQAAAQAATYERTVTLIRDYFQISGSQRRLLA